MSTTSPTGSSTAAVLGSAVAAGQRPPRPTALSASLSFGWRAMLKIKHVPEQIGDAIGIPIIFTLMFTYLFGGALVGSIGEYLQFLLPGSLVMAVLMVTIYAGVGLNSDIEKRVFDRFRTLPVWRWAPVIGSLMGDLGRYLIASGVVIALGLALGFRPDGGVTGVVAAVSVVVFFSLSVSWIWTALGLIARTPSAVMNIGMLVLFPITFASNIFVDPQTMPRWLEMVVNVNPVTNLVTTVRELMAGTAAAGRVASVLVASAVLIGVFAPLTMRLYERKS